MRALLSGDERGIDGLRLGDIAKPVPAAGQVLVRVAAAAINYPDVLLIDDKYQYKPQRPFAPGGELAGIVDAVGEGVAGFAPGDRVLALSLSGALAEYTLAPADRTHKIPPELPDDQAAALMMTYATALHALVDRGALVAGETVLVLGAAGGVGLASIEVARALGAHVVAAVSSAEKAAAATDAGAHDCVIYPEDLSDPAAQRALSEAFKSACASTPSGAADIIVDPVGGPYSEAALRAIGWHGRFLVIGFPAGIARLPLNLALLKSCEIIGVFMGGELERGTLDFARCADDLIAMCLDGRLRPRIDRHFALKDGAEAIRVLAERKARGKLVVMID